MLDLCGSFVIEKMKYVSFVKADRELNANWLKLVYKNEQGPSFVSFPGDSKTMFLSLMTLV